ncbi:MAG: glycosyltransferase family 4 protein [Chloroflexi bacterium]|nr:glycosyltransferase family 4 protein [Chloroflexota bacterium]
MNSPGSTANRIRVLLDAVTLADPPTGVATYATQLAAALAARPDIDVGVAFPVAGPRGTRQHPPSRKHRQLWRQLVLPRLLSRESYDVYHGTEYGSLLRSPVPRVATVHDLFFRNLRKLFDHRGRWHMRAMLQTALAAERIVVPARHVGEQLTAEFGYPAARVRIVYEAPTAGMRPASAESVARVRQELGFSEPYLLCVGIGHRGKRTIDVLRAAVLLRERGLTVPMVLVGWPDPRVGEALQREAARLGLGDIVSFTDYYRGDLAALYSGALAFVFPSIEEGFGIPPLEAMACGTPVIAARAPAMDETLQGAALFVPTRSPEAIAARVAELAGSSGLRDHWRGKGLEHAARFSWERAAAETVEIYRELL